MAFTVFYAWQMDRDKRVNKWFIHKATEDAIKDVLADLRLEDAPAVDAAEQGDADPDIELDHDTKDEPGTPNIAESIFRKIKDCGIFLADVTLVSSSETADGRTKALPNSNVMIELGSAVATVDWGRIILVMNTAYGSPDGLPFDLKHRSFPITYNLDSPTDPKKAEVRKQLRRDIAEKIKTMQRVGVWTKKAEDEKKAKEAEEDAQQRRAESAREEFENRMARNAFHHFRADRGIFTLCVIPANPLRKPMAFGNDHMRAAKVTLPPLRRDFGIVRLDATSLFSSFPDLPDITTDPNPPTPAQLTELTDRGLVFAVDNWVYGSTKDDAEPSRYRMNSYQPDVTQSLRCYLNYLKELGVTGPWYVGISMQKQENSLLLFHDRDDSPMQRAGRRIVRHDGFKPYMVFVPADAAVLKFDDVAALIKPAFDQIWKGYGVEYGSPRYNERGDYLGF